MRIHWPVLKPNVVCTYCGTESTSAVKCGYGKPTMGGGGVMVFTCDTYLFLARYGSLYYRFSCFGNV